MTRYVEDSTQASALQRGMYGYAGYWNGPFANLTAIRRSVPPVSKVIGVATRLAGSKGADAIDLEPGTCGGDQASNFAAGLQWLRQGYSGEFRRPLIYTMASWLAPLEAFLARNGVARDRYWTWSAHYGVSEHYCGPKACGYGLSQADATQYLFTPGYDRSCFQDYLFSAAPVPVPAPVPATVQLGSSGSAVRDAQGRLAAWGYLPADAVDGSFGSWTELAVVAFQKAHDLAEDGIVGPVTWTALRKDVTAKAPEPVPQPPYQYGTPYGLKVAIGRTSFKASWLPPAHAGQPDPEFQVLVYQAMAKNGSLLAPSYPRVTSGTQYQGGSLERHTAYVLQVVAGTGEHARPLAFAQAAFRTA